MRVVLADDHQIMREGLRFILGRQSDIQVVGEASNGNEALELVEKLSPDVVVMDIAMPDLNGIEATRRITKSHPEVKVVGLSGFSDRRYVVGMLEAGAKAFLLKDSAGEELVRALDAVRRGRKFISAEIAGSLLANQGAVGEITDPGIAPGPLASRERQVLQMLAEGKSSKQIAVELGISVRTAETHRKNIMLKLDLHNLADLTRYALREGIITLDR